MRTLLPDPPPAEVKELLARRRRWGADTHDEVWEGVLHVVPAPSGEHATLSAQVKRMLAPLADAADLTVSDEFNLGDSKDDFRVPDGGLHRSSPHGIWLATAALVLEIVSPGDDTWEKLPFYAAHHVDEVLIVDPEARAVHWLGLNAGAGGGGGGGGGGGAEYEPIERSGLIELGAAQLAELIDWP